MGVWRNAANLSMSNSGLLIRIVETRPSVRGRTRFCSPAWWATELVLGSWGRPETLGDNVGYFSVPLSLAPGEGKLVEMVLKGR